MKKEKRQLELAKPADELNRLNAMGNEKHKK